MGTAEFSIEDAESGAVEEKIKGAKVAIFCQVIPPLRIFERKDLQVIWIPMWDAVRRQRQLWWDSLPKRLKVVAFSEQIAIRAANAGLQTLRLQYYKNPDQFEPVQFESTRTAFYWNRCGLVSPRFLETFCEALNIDNLLYKLDLDPYADNRVGFELPETVGKTRVITLTRQPSREDFLETLKQANIVIAPRPYEGIGMLTLESLARGCAVFSTNLPAANEYIEHKHSGYLFEYPYTLRRIYNVVYKKLRKPRFLPSLQPHYMLSDRQKWDEISALNLTFIGQNAREMHMSGYKRWKDDIPRFREFVLGKL